MAVTLADIARTAGVSASTVSRALNNSSHRVNRETQQHILSIAQELGYRPNLLARGLRGDPILTVGIIVDNISSPFAPPFVRGILDQLAASEYAGLVVNSDWNPEAEAEIIQMLTSRPVDGIVFVDTWLHPTHTLPYVNKPHVFVNRFFDSSCGNCIRPDDRGGACLAIQHLVQLGHRRIAFIQGPDGWVASAERLAGYKDVLAASNIPFEPWLLSRGSWELQDGYRATRALLALPDRPDAIFASNDLMALGAIYAIQDMGLRVPDDMAVMGYDDRDFSSIVRPALSTVRMPCYEMGQAAAGLLIAQLHGHEPSPEVPLVPSQLVIRESCGAKEGKRTAEGLRTRTTPKRLFDFIHQSPETG
jgi:LacI family transcriptional regulator